MMPNQSNRGLRRRLSIRPVLAAAVAVLATSAAAPAAERTFDFTYAFTVTGLTPGQSVRVWFPTPSANDAQQLVGYATARLPPGAAEAADPVFHNGNIYFQAKAGPDGTIPVSVTRRIIRRSIDRQPVYAHENVADDLKPNELVPIDGRPAAFLYGKVVPAADTAKARFLFDTVYDALVYSKAKPGWGRGDVNWVCDSKSGNCSDFHSLFLSLARANNLPAKMEFGFIVPAADKPPTIASYHCWAFYKPADGPDWVPVDISAAKNRPAKKDYYFGHLDENRVTFSTGRDVNLEPKQDGPPLNFFVYPYAEVDGKPWPQENIKLALRATPVNDPTTQPAAPNQP